MSVWLKPCDVTYQTTDWMLKPLPPNKTINVLRSESRVGVIIVVVDADRIVSLQWLQINTECFENVSHKLIC